MIALVYPIIENFVQSKFVILSFCSIHFTIIIAGLIYVVRYTEDFGNIARGSLNPRSIVYLCFTKCVLNDNFIHTYLLNG